MRTFTAVALLAVYMQGVAADGNDWVNPSFVLQKSGLPEAQKKISEYAKSSASQGPWTVFGDSTVLPPNGDKLDYLSWAPYHWPDCNWCTGPRTHLTTGGNRTNSDGEGNSDTDSSGDSDDSSDYGDDDAGAGDSDGDGDGGENTGEENAGDDDDDDDDDDDVPPLPDLPSSAPATESLPAAHRRMIRRVRRFAHAPAPRKRAVLVAPGDTLQLNLSQRDIPDVTSITLPTGVPDTQPSSTSDNVAGGSAAAAENARNTQKAQPNPKTTSAPKGQATHQAPPSKTTAGGSDSDCTPSPSKSMPPSATWTTCNYVTKDGQLNPDVRLLNGVIAIVDVTQSVLWNVVASVLAGTSDTAQTAVQFMQGFFLDDKTGMHPRVAYGQVIRGPGQQVGEFLGVIDLRGMVKIANAIQIMRAAGTSAWTSTLDAQMVAWTQQYVKWLQSSSIGQTALSAPNNHGSFATNQLAAMNILIQNQDDAAAALNAYFKKQFQDQIAASGEQPFEAVRTRPYHYRCFNLEAMITNAKLGDQLGLNFWTTKSKYGATIKDALDFTLRQNPGKEDVSDIFPHVAAIAAAYGDADGKYAAFLKRADDSYLTAPYYYYDQTAALMQAPNAGPKAKGKSVQSENDDREQQRLGQDKVTDSLAPTPTNSNLPFATPTIPWACPAAFATATQVQLDDGVYVTCDELKHLYGYTDKAKNV